MTLATRLCASLLLLAGISPAWAEDASLFRFRATPGPYAVGLRVVEQYDRSRTFHAATDALGRPYAGERARPVQTLVWYPAQKTAQPPMPYGDYVKLFETETSFGHPTDTFENHAIKPFLGAHLAAPTWAVRDATPAAGRFPVVIYAPGAWHPGWENSDICEYLASHGYVVLASPSLGATTRKVTIDLPGAYAVAHDVSFLIGYAATLPFADTTEVAAMGHSWGGIAGLFAAAHDNRIKALVGLDGSIRYYPDLIRQADIHVDRLQLPLLYFIGRNMSLELWDGAALSRRTEPDVLNHWQTGDLMLVHMLGLYHQIFNSLMQRQSDIWPTFARMPFYAGDYSRDEAGASYGWMARYSLAFLDHYLKHDAAALDFLNRAPAANGVAPHLLDTSFQPASARPQTIDAFRQEAGRIGFDRLPQALASFREKNANFTLPENGLEEWAETLIADGRSPEAVAVLKLDVTLHPKSAGAFDALGDALARTKDKPAAIAAYRSAIALEPDDSEIAAKLTRLEKRQRVVIDRP